MSLSVLNRARESGKCPPSLILKEPEKDRGFEDAVATVIDPRSKFHSNKRTNNPSPHVFLFLQRFAFFQIRILLFSFFR